MFYPTSATTPFYVLDATSSNWQIVILSSDNSRACYALPTLAATGPMTLTKISNGASSDATTGFTTYATFNTDA